MRREAFTLLETMIVILIVAAISAIALPPLAARATAGRMGAAVSAVESAASLASTEAARGSRIIALVAEQWDDEWVLWAEEVKPEQVGELLRPADDAPPLPPEESETRRIELAAFDRVEFTDTLPPLEDELQGPELLDDAPAEEVDWGDSAFSWEAERQRFVLAVFFPDGACRVGPTMYLIGQDGERRSVRLRPLTGRVNVRTLPRVSEELEQMEEAEGESDLPPLQPPTGREGGGP